MSEFVQLSHNPRRQWYETPGASQALITAHHINHKNCSSDITQTLVNAHKLSSNTQTRKPVTHQQDKRSTMDEMRASAPKAFIRSKTGPPRPAVQMDAGARVWGEYGSGLIAKLVNELTPLSGRGFSRQNLQNMRLFYLNCPLDKIRQMVSGRSDDNSIEVQLGDLFNALPLPWSACVRLQSVQNVQARESYEIEALRAGWSVRQLRHPTFPRRGKAASPPPGKLHLNWVAKQRNCVQNSDIMSLCQNVNRRY